MNDIKKIIELAEHPELFTEEQMTELLSDEENLKLYLTVSEAMMAMETPRASRRQKPRRIVQWAAVAACMAALIIPASLNTWEKPATDAQAVVAEDVMKRDLPDKPQPSPEDTVTVKEPHPAIEEPAAQERVAERTEEDITDTDIENILRLQQARMDNELAICEAEALLAEYYAAQMANMEKPCLPTVNACSGDNDIPQANIMTLIMQ